MPADKIELEPQYDPKKVEGRIYELWENSGYFNPDNLPEATQTVADKTQTGADSTRTVAKKSPPLSASSPRRSAFTIVVPPPNITGSLHMGHALNATIQDILIRKKRMEGYKTLWLPGTDHAGIATQNVVEKELKKQGISRHDLGREKFIEKIWEWKEKYGNIILVQFKKLGSSMDWSRARFTMDKEYQKAVEIAFIHYYNKGWIYRAERVINWCSRCQTSLSDLELEYQEAQSVLYYIKYPLKHDEIGENDEDGEVVQTLSPSKALHQAKRFTKRSDSSNFITVATVRPETMLGDSAVAVNLKDKRYKNLIGKKVLLPIQNREILIVADEKIDMEFGTGAVKVTPAHDALDAEIGEKNKLPFYKVINEYGKMTKEAGVICEGLKTAECRDRVIIELKKQNLIEKEEPYQHNIAVCYRCGTVIEPIPSLQWFVKMKDLAKLAIKAVESEKVKFHPDRWKNVYLDWLKNIRDWNISRQIWWGHRIPLWQCVFCQNIILSPKIITKIFFVRHGETDWNKEERFQGHREVPLNETGRSQAKEAAAYLAKQNIDLIISSDLVRCKETAEIINEQIKTELIFDERFRERHGGILEGTTKEEREKVLSRDKLYSYDYKIPEGESIQELEARVVEALGDHKSAHAHKTVAIITHGGPIRMVNKNIRNLSYEESRHEKYDSKNTQVWDFVITESCVNCRNDIIEPVTDVLDTWFSSALWPFATLHWPSQCQPTINNSQPTTCKPVKNSDLSNFYPTQVLSTARDIINLWVSRMVFSGLEFTKKPPFSDVIIHATILTKDGKRMSKSLGTGVDPMTLIEKYGADATRFGLIWQSMGGQDIHWAEEHVVAGKKFCNKIWNAARFVLQNAQPATCNLQPTTITPKTNDDKKILKSLEKTKKEVDVLIEKYEFGQALHELHNFFWHEFCDVYIEASKLQITNPQLQKNTQEILLYVLSESLKLLHPFIPFITEEIWSHLPLSDKKMLIIESWPGDI